MMVSVVSLGRRGGMAVIVLLALLAGWTALPIAAHPLGNAAVNRYSRLEIGAQQVTIHYVFDLAETPAAREIQAIDADRDGTVGEAEAAAYTARRIAGIQAGLRLTVNDAAVRPRAERHTLTFPAGQGGMKTLRLAISFVAPLPPGALRLTYQDTNEAEGQGWREVVASAAGGRMLSESTVPATDISDELRRYPDDRLANPLDVRTARFTVTAAPGASGNDSVSRGVEPARDTFLALIAGDLSTLPMVLVSLVIAFGLGAGYALWPGCGAGVVAAGLIGTRPTARQAVGLGLTVAITHLLGVVVLGLMTVLLARPLLPERLLPWIGAMAGLLVIVLGLGLVRSRLAARRQSIGPAATMTSAAVAAAIEPALVSARAGGGVALLDAPPPSLTAGGSRAGADSWIGQEHGFGPDRGRGHAPSPNANAHRSLVRITWRGQLAVGVAVGLVLCPSALAVLLGAIAMQRVGIGLLLILAFSAGMATVLIGIGLLVQVGGRYDRRSAPSGLLRALPVAGAALVALIGVVLVIQALGGAGLRL